MRSMYCVCGVRVSVQLRADGLLSTRGCETSVQRSSASWTRLATAPRRQLQPAIVAAAVVAAAAAGTLVLPRPVVLRPASLPQARTVGADCRAGVLALRDVVVSLRMSLLNFHL
jgi:hypothetical protein